MFTSIENFYERLVMDQIHILLKNKNRLADKAYIADIACVALNYLPPRYVRHSIDLVSRLSDAERKKMQEEVIDAVGFALATTKRRQATRDGK